MPTSTPTRKRTAKTVTAEIAQAPISNVVAEEEVVAPKVPEFVPQTSGERAWVLWSNHAPKDEAYYRRLDRMIDATKAYAKEHYEESGWDFVIESMDDDAIREIVWRARTDAGAIKKMGEHVALLAEVRSETTEQG